MNSDNNHHRYSARIALGMRLKHWRLGEYHKISEVAGLIGVSTATWGHWETGEHLPSGELLIAIEDLTGLPLHVLFCPYLDNCPQLKGDRVLGADHRCCQFGSSESGNSNCC